MRLKDWIKSGLQYAAIVIGASFLYGVLMGTESMEEMMTMTAMYMLMFGAVINMLFNISTYKVVLPLALGFSSTRKEAFVGMQCYRLIYAVLVMGAAVGVYLMAGLGGMTELAQFGPIGVGLMPMMTALGGMLGIIGNRFGKGVLTAMTVVGSLIGCVLLASTLILSAIFEEQIGILGLWLFPVVSLVIYGVVSIFEYRAVMKYSVKL